MIPRPALRHMRAAMRQHERAQSYLEPEIPCRWGEPDRDGFMVCLTRRDLNRAIERWASVIAGLEVGTSQRQAAREHWNEATRRLTTHHCTPPTTPAEDHGDRSCPDPGTPSPPSAGTYHECSRRAYEWAMVSTSDTEAWAEAAERFHAALYALQGTSPKRLIDYLEEQNGSV